MRRLITSVVLGFLAVASARAESARHDSEMPQVSKIPAAQAAFESGSRALNDRHYQRALSLFTMCIASDNKAAQAYDLRGFCNFALEKPQLALPDLDTAIKLDPSLDHAYRVRSDIYFDCHQPEKALKDMDKACQLRPNHEPHFYQRGKLLEAQGDWQRALKDYQRCVELRPNMTQAYYRRANLELELGQYQKAAEDFTHNIHMPHAEDIEASYANRAKCYERLGKHDLAKKDGQTARQMTENGWGAFMRSEKKR